MTVIPFSQALRERTRGAHSESEGANFMDDLMKGKGTRDDYVALVVQHYFIYKALEAAAAQFADSAEAAAFISPQLTRLPALEADLDFLMADDWRSQIAALPTTQRYVARINEIAAEGWAGGFIAHHYTRYLGDLSGGQVIKRVVQRAYGFTDGAGFEFYIFDRLDSLPRFKKNYRAVLDALDLDEAEQTRVVDEVRQAYQFNSELMAELNRSLALASSSDLG